MSEIDKMSDDDRRARFHELGAQRAHILAASVPLREQRDAITQAADKQAAELNAAITDAERGLFEIDMERGSLARALGGKTGEPT